MKVETGRELHGKAWSLSLEPMGNGSTVCEPTERVPVAQWRHITIFGSDPGRRRGTARAVRSLDHDAEAGHGGRGCRSPDADRAATLTAEEHDRRVRRRILEGAITPGQLGGHGRWIAVYECLLLLTIIGEHELLSRSVRRRGQYRR